MHTNLIYYVDNFRVVYLVDEGFGVSCEKRRNMSEFVTVLSQAYEFARADYHHQFTLGR